MAQIEINMAEAAEATAGSNATLTGSPSGDTQPGGQGLPSAEEAIRAAESIVGGSANVSPEARLGNLFRRSGTPGVQNAAVSETTQRVNPPEQAAVPPGQEPPDGGREGNDGRGGDNEGPEGSRNIEPNSGPEWETSPERGRWLVEKIVFMETKLPYEVRYNAENGPILNEYYAKLKAFVERFQEDRDKESAFDPLKEHQVEVKEGEGFLQAVQRTYDEWLNRGVVPPIPPGQEELPPPEDLTGTNLQELINSYNNLLSRDPQLRARAITELATTREGLLKYFREAKRKDLLKGVDAILDAIYAAYTGGELSPDRIRIHADQQIAGAYNTAENEFLAQIEHDPDVSGLFGVWEPYLRMARAGLEREFNDRIWTPENGEWHPSGEEDEGQITETFWSPYGGYPDYYVVTARTPAEFRRAMESFIEIIRNGSLGYSPTDLMNNIQNFQRVFSARASLMANEHAIRLKKENRPIGPDDMTVDIATENRQELQGRAFLWYSFYQYEHYNKEEAKSGATAMALNEGPARHTAVLRSGEEGEVGSGTWDYDYLPEIELALNTQGSRGQLGSYTPAQEYLRDTIFEIQTEKRMGVVLKDYDRRDTVLTTNFNLRAKRDKRLEEIERYLRRRRGNLNTLSDEDRNYYLAQKAHTRKNRHRIGIHQSSEEMRSLYEGFDNGDAHRRVYQEFKGLNAEEIQQLPRRLQKSFRLGMVQTTMDQVRQEIRNGVVRDGKKVVFKKDDDLPLLTQVIDRLVEEKQIQEIEKGLYRKIYQDAYARAKAGFEVTQQLEGVSHESTVRGGGVYFIYRNRGVVNYVREYLDFRDKPRKDRKASDPDISKWSPQQRKANFTHDQHLGWIIDEMSKGRRKDSFPPEEQALYELLNLDERETFVDNVPIHSAQEYGMAAVNWIKMRYADDDPIWQEDRFKIKDASGEMISVIDAKDANDQYLYPNFRAIYRTAVLNKTLEMVINEFATKGFSAKLRYTEYDFDIKSFDPQKGGIEITPKGESKVMTLKRPHIFGYTQLGQPIIAFDNEGKPIFGYDQDGNPISLGAGDFDELGQAIIYDKPADIVRNGQITEHRRRINLNTRNPVFLNDAYKVLERDDGKKRGRPSSFVFVEEVELDFQNAVDSDLALHTTHTYWAYQSNNTHTLIPEYVLNQARQIRDGLIRPEDADIFAGLLLTLDPTLSRVKSFSGDKMTLEGIVFDAAVEESLMGSVYVKSALNKKTMPVDGNSEFMGIGYYTEDLGGDMGFSMEAVARAAKMPKRWARRFAAVLNSTPIYVDSMARNVGRKGVTGATTMMADNIKDLTHQPVMSQFALTKFINMIDSSAALWFALVGGTDPKTGQHHEGLFMKPTNNADQLARLRDKFPHMEQLPNQQNEAFYALLESYGRAWDTLKVIRTMYSDVRNAGGALLLERKDVFLPNGRINPEITAESERNTGTSRHIAKMFWDAYVEWILDEGPGGGQQAYGDVAHIYKMLEDPCVEDRWIEKGELFIDQTGKPIESDKRQKVAAQSVRLGNKWVEKGEMYINRDGVKMRSNERQQVVVRVSVLRTWADWLFDKMAL